MSLNIKDKKILESAIDIVLKKFQNQDFLVQDFNNYSKILRDEYFKNQNLRTRKRVCCIIGCKEKAIQNSHSIPKSAVLKNISDNNHVLTPVFDFNSNIPKNKMSLVGINKASVFPGYCIKHENIFKLFENDGIFDTPQKALLQTYRTISRERISREIELQISEKINNKYKSKINNEAKKYLQTLLKKHPHLCNIQDIKIDGLDSILNSLAQQDKILKHPNEQFKRIETSILGLLINLPIKNDLVVRVMKIDIKFPISICGFGNQSFMHHEVKKDLVVLVNVMPLVDSTFIICAGLEQDMGVLETFLNFSFADPLNLLNLIESFMINGTDHWFINPTYWNKFSKDKQDKILYDIIFTEESFLDEYKFSIFDDIRIKILETLTENMKSRNESIKEHETNKINSEYSKLDNSDYITINDDKILADMLHKMLHKIK